MGNGNYSQAAHEALLRGRANIPVQQVFKQGKCHPLMNPKGVRLRESRDGADHPQSLGIVFALDVTGSMGEIPRIMATQQLPIFMKTLMDYRSRPVRLTDERLAHLLEHTELAGMEGAVAGTVRAPELVVQSRADASAALYYRFYTRTLVGDRWLCVVVKYEDEEAFVLTAYLTDKPKRGELIWRRT